MASLFSALAQRKLLIVTGKGGAGKSVLSLALAHRLSTSGRKVWLVELGRKRDRQFTRLPDLVGKKELHHTPTELTLPKTRTKISVSVLDPTQSLSEYVDLKLPTGGLAGLLLNNQVTASFLEVVPGLPDLVHLGKIWHSLTQLEGGPDTVILDAPATGHAVALLSAPENFRRITKVGPIFRDASLMVDFFSDPEKTALVFAALPEEMAVQETLDLQRLLGKNFPKPNVFVNKCFPELPPLKDEQNSLPWKAYRYAKERGDRERDAAAQLKGAQKIPFFFPEPDALPLFLRISEHLE